MRTVLPDYGRAVLFMASPYRRSFQAVSCIFRAIESIRIKDRHMGSSFDGAPAKAVEYGSGRGNNPGAM